MKNDLNEEERFLADFERRISLGLQGLGKVLLAVSGGIDSMGLAEAAFRALDQRRGQIERAYTAGEIPLVELVRARVGAFEADAFRARARATQNRARSRLNQALGAMP